MMKYSLHVPVAQYGFVLVEDVPGEKVKEEYDGIMNMFSEKAGLPDKEFDLFIENQLSGNYKNHIETYNQLSPEQQKHYQINKRAIARLKYTSVKEANRLAEDIN